MPSGCTSSTSTRRSGAARTGHCSRTSWRALDVAVEMSGGIRDDESLRRALATGCARVNIGTAALEDPEWCAKAIAEHGDRVAVGLDVRGTTLSARGWTQDGGELFDVLDRLDRDGCARYVVTDVGRDGTMTGPNLDLLRSVCAATDRPVVASGGVSSLDDLRAIAKLVPDGVEGAIVGKALYAGRSRWRTPWPRCGHDAPTVSSVSPFEDVVGYTRAVAAGDQVWVSGCTSVVDGEVAHVGDIGCAGERRRSAIIESALAELGCTLADVVRTRIFVTDISRWQEVAAAHLAAFGDARPATTMVEVTALIDPRLLVEIEAVAYKPGVGRDDRRRAGHPVPRRRRRTGREGRQLHRPARRRRPGRDGAGL